MRRLLARMLRAVADALDAPQQNVDPWASKTGRTLVPPDSVKLADPCTPTFEPSAHLPARPPRVWLPGEWGGPYV